MKTAKNDNSPKWYIVACRPSMERQAGEEIISLGQTVYVPCYRREYHHRRQRKWIKRFYPLMPGYLFILASEHWGRVLDCSNVTRVLRSQRFGEASVPISVSDGDVQAIRLAQDAGRFDEMRVTSGSVKIGDLVKVSDGAFSGHFGKVDEVNDQNIVLLISAMCRQVRVTAPIAKLAATG